MTAFLSIAIIATATSISTFLAYICYLIFFKTKKYQRNLPLTHCDRATITDYFINFVLFFDFMVPLNHFRFRVLKILTGETINSQMCRLLRFFMNLRNKSIENRQKDKKYDDCWIERIFVESSYPNPLNMKINSKWATGKIPCNIVMPKSLQPEKLSSLSKPIHLKKLSEHLVIFYFHAGGMALRSNIQGPIMNWVHLLATRANCIVVQVDYCLAPEFPFSENYRCGFLDGYDAIRELVNENQLTNYLLLGDSAGGNVAITSAYKITENKMDFFTLPKAVIPCYSAVDGSLFGHNSYIKFASPCLHKNICISFMGIYAAGLTDNVIKFAQSQPLGLFPFFESKEQEIVLKTSRTELCFSSESITSLDQWKEVSPLKENLSTISLEIRQHRDNFSEEISPEVQSLVDKERILESNPLCVTYNPGYRFSKLRNRLKQRREENLIVEEKYIKNTRTKIRLTKKDREGINNYRKSALNKYYNVSVASQTELLNTLQMLDVGILIAGCEFDCLIDQNKVLYRRLTEINQNKSKKVEFYLIKGGYHGVFSHCGGVRFPESTRACELLIDKICEFISKK